MKIVKKKTSELSEGDILIIHWPDVRSFVQVESEDYVLSKCEGESEVFIFEIDSIDVEFIDEENEIGNKFTFYHMDDVLVPLLSDDEDRAAVPWLKIEGMDDYEWDVIDIQKI